MAEFGLRRYFFLSRRPRCNAKEMAEQNSKCRKTEFKVDLIKNYLHCHIVTIIYPVAEEFLGKTDLYCFTIEHPRIVNIKKHPKNALKPTCSICVVSFGFNSQRF